MRKQAHCRSEAAVLLSMTLTDASERDHLKVLACRRAVVPVEMDGFLEAELDQGALIHVAVLG